MELCVGVGELLYVFGVVVIDFLVVRVFIFVLVV